MDCRQQNVGYDTGITNQKMIFKHLDLVFQKVWYDL
jgi:hypothetical protein